MGNIVAKEKRRGSHSPPSAHDDAGRRRSHTSPTHASLLQWGTRNEWNVPSSANRRVSLAQSPLTVLQSPRNASALNDSGANIEISPTDTVDGGYLVVQGVYTGPQDFHKAKVAQLQIERRLGPFYKPLQDFDPSWSDSQLLAALNGLPIPDSSSSYDSSTNIAAPGTGNSSRLSDEQLEMIRLYREPVECPICFLYYPPYVNFTRCCDQPICSECFVQMKRPEPHKPIPQHDAPSVAIPPDQAVSTSHITGLPEEEELISEPTCCPFCAEPNFGVLYNAPPIQTGIKPPSRNSHTSPLIKESHIHRTDMIASSTNTQTAAPIETSASAPSIHFPQSVAVSVSENDAPTSVLSGSFADRRRRRHSLPPLSPQVVTTDMIRPDWASKLAAARAKAVRTAATATAIHHAVFMGSSAELNSRRYRGGASRRSSTRESRRASRRAQDLEEMMVMEAIRISLLDEEERRLRELQEARSQTQHEHNDESNIDAIISGADDDLPMAGSSSPSGGNGIAATSSTDVSTVNADVFSMHDLDSTLPAVDTSSTNGHSNDIDAIQSTSKTIGTGLTEAKANDSSSRAHLENAFALQ
ncbi:hypothetical protein CANCADRAFT_2407 [Tortispora caseinolytica NRRL Y-17796]|uniref:Protein SIP5 n=1 Tax=Tortispora caseinolytica NRRL Y-17796 TaxID=767744 RepID=A0A1E4TG41_9ASCO|nr:hypothetical protein CANCADRAFT_2407 [Tortispora caseinolytica NRRL Y-17796]